jgi:hypothetical protein
VFFERAILLFIALPCLVVVVATVTVVVAVMVAALVAAMQRWW